MGLRSEKQTNCQIQGSVVPWSGSLQEAKLLNHFLNLRAKHIYLSAYQVAAECDACHAVVPRLRDEGG